MPGKQDLFRGAFLGIAVGDAMGYAVDDKTLQEIISDYGPNGLLGYDLVNGYAEVTSYTQIAAFAANGLLLALTRGQQDPQMLPRYIGLALREWARTQHYTGAERNYCWLSRTPELKRRRCMDTRMVDALSRENLGTMEKPVYRSDHPGALTAAIPVALLSGIVHTEPDTLDRIGAATVALTHGDPSAFLSGAALTHGVSLLIQQPDISVSELLQDTVDNVQMQFGRTYSQTTGIWELLQLAMTLASSEEITQLEAMELLRCRTAPEVLAGALYACVTSHGDFDAAMITAVNHSGHSSAVGAIVGAVMGLRQGQQILPEFYLECLEPALILQELANDFAQGNPQDRAGLLFDDDWEHKYIYGGG